MQRDSGAREVVLDGEVPKRRAPVGLFLLLDRLVLAILSVAHGLNRCQDLAISFLLLRVPLLTLFIPLGFRV